MSRPKSRVVVVSVDDSAHSEDAVAWAATNVVQLSDTVHIITVIAPTPDPAVSLGIYSGSPFSLAPIPSATSHQIYEKAHTNWEHEESERVAKTEHMLRQHAKKLGMSTDLASTDPAASTSRARAELHVLKQGGNPALVIAKFADDIKADLVVVGSRGLGSMQRKFMGLVGLGSVSDYLGYDATFSVAVSEKLLVSASPKDAYDQAVHHLTCPTLVVKSGRKQESHEHIGQLDERVFAHATRHS